MDKQKIGLIGALVIAAIALIGGIVLTAKGVEVPYAGISAKVGPLIQAYGFDSANRSTATQSISTGAWTIVRWRHASSNVYLRVGSAAEGTGATLGTIGDVASAVFLGNGASASPGNSSIAAVVAMQTDPTSDEDTTIMRWLNWYAGN